ncbi:hypothetical protein SEA_ZUKO_65 [Streptomyces phage Zuko]|uniref:Uncharacterized protein n=1 Tax=Streptomyces phage Zuko TaxID=2601695 RepID=A0A5J6D7I8_9CAUD|nr:hypothetical protein PP630_gp065 [Streptomyces phage Zuko]QEQ93643.1 hypothetical protein SEA_ZUKO_65 [Streptomyces phage Zuko]
MAKGGAVDTEARGRSVMAGHARLRKYQIKYRAGYWLARIPYGSWNQFDTWADASEYLTVRHEVRVAKEAERERRRERDSHAHA